MHNASIRGIYNKKVVCPFFSVDNLWNGWRDINRTFMDYFWTRFAAVGVEKVQRRLIHLVPNAWKRRFKAVMSQSLSFSATF